LQLEIARRTSGQTLRGEGRPPTFALVLLDRRERCDL
jgi:hypothetical protein